MSKLPAKAPVVIRTVPVRSSLRAVSCSGRAALDFAVGAGGSFTRHFALAIAGHLAGGRVEVDQPVEDGRTAESVCVHSADGLISAAGEEVREPHK